jgi:DNA-binding CsgD family transcriptional regulator
LNTTNTVKKDYTPFAALESCLSLVVGSKDLQDVCRRIVHADLFAPSTIGAWIYKIDNGTVLTEVVGYGKAVQDGLSEFPLWDENPLSKSIKEKRYVFEVAGQLGQGSALGSIPIFIDDVPIAACVLVLDQGTKESPVDGKVLENLGTLIGSLFGKDNKQSSTRSGSTGDPSDLTSRQITIIGFMAEGLTNLEISQRVLMSESTVRQETIRIYRALGVNDRKSAVSEARKLNIISTNF